MTWMIDRDYLNSGEGGRVGVCNTRERVAGEERFRFRLLDDDGEVYYGGWYTEDELEEDSLYGALDFAMHDAGAVRLDVKLADVERFFPGAAEFYRRNRDGDWTALY